MAGWSELLPLHTQRASMPLSRAAQHGADSLRKQLAKGALRGGESQEPGRRT